MFGTCNGCCLKSGCVMNLITKMLVIIGGVNWGLVGVGMFLDMNLNLVNILLGSWPMVESIVYIVVGVAAVLMIFGCKCKTCAVPAEAAPVTPNTTA